MSSAVTRAFIAGAGVAAAFASSAHGSAQAPSRQAAWTLDVAPLTSPAAVNSAQPQLSVHGDRALVSWIERRGETATLRFAERTESGWTPARSAAAGDNFFVNWADVPSVVRLQDGTLAAHWLQKSAASTYAYDVRLSFSGDDGRTWSASVTPHHDGTPTEHGFASLFQMPGAGLGLIWLDGRQMKHDTHDGADGVPMSVRSAVFGTSRQQISEALVDDRVCECCPTAAAVTSDGPIVAFRNRTTDEIRDIYVTRHVGGRWTVPAAVHQDNWRIAACPVNGPALSAHDRTVAIAWFTGVGDEGHVYAAFSSDAGQTFGTPVRIDDEAAVGRVDIELLPDRAAAVSWIEFANQRSQFKIRRVERGGARSASIGVAGIPAGRASGYPRLARRANELLFAWTEPGDTPQVKTASARLDGRGTAAR